MKRRNKLVIIVDIDWYIGFCLLFGVGMREMDDEFVGLYTANLW